MIANVNFLVHIKILNFEGLSILPMGKRLPLINFIIADGCLVWCDMVEINLFRGRAVFTFNT